MRLPIRVYHARGYESMKYATAFSFLILFLIGLALPQTADAQKSACLKDLTGKNGCYDSAGGCKRGFEYCKTPERCSNNGGEMDRGVCVQRGTASGKGSPTNSESAASCAAKGGTYDPDHYGCYCSTDASGNPIRPPAGGTCANAAVAAPAPVAATIPSTGNTQLDQCLQKWDSKAQECVVSAELAVKSCDQDETSDEGMKYVKDFTKNFSSQSIAANAGKGAASQCAQASLIGNTAINGMNLFKSTCDESFSTCNKECEEVHQASRSSVIADECLQFAVTDDEKIKTANTISGIINASQKGNNKCTVEAKEERGILEQTMGSIAKSVQAAKICECQLAGAGANCDLVPNPINCAPGGPLFGQQICNIYASHDCSLGSQQYSSIPCQCARDSSASVCKTPAGKPVPSNFAVDLKPGTNGGVDVGGPGGVGDDGGNMNLGGNYNVNKPGFEYKDPAETAKGGKPGGGGGNPGGGGGARGGGDPNALAAGEDDGSTKGLAGLFNQAKSSLSNLLGGGNKVTGKGLSPNGGGQGLKYDINKWRPRGLASAGCQSHQVRCKNEDIFSIVNRRYDVNEPTFLYGP